MKKHIILLLYAGTIMNFTGCATGLQRTNLDDFQEKKIPSMGIRMELPKKQERFTVFDNTIYVKNTDSKGLIFSLHPIYPSGLFAEPLYLINFSLVLMHKKAYLDYLKKRHVENGDRRFEDTKFHNQITEFKQTHPNGRTPLLCFRKDYKNEKTGEVVLAAATYLDNYYGNIKHKKEDIKAIKRILNSIRFLKP